MYICNSCGHSSTKFFGLCNKCNDGVGVESEDEVKASPLSSTKQVANLDVEIKRVNKEAEEQVASRFTKYVDFNSILSSSNGFVDGQVILMGASPGVGKSTLCTSIMDEDSLYISSEENYNQVNSRILRVNPNCNCEIFTSTDIIEIVSAINKSKSKLVVVDSLNSINFGVGYVTTARYAEEIKSAIKNLNKIVIIISQVSKSGEISGMNSIIHLVDTVLFLERSEISSTIIATSSKNRYGEIGEVAIFRHEANGFVEIESEDLGDEKIVGSTVTQTKFGHKNMKIAVDALVAPSQSSYGLRKSNGYNQNRLIQLIGILSYFGKLSITDRDIYVNISNGLSTDDISIELAMANSILSSYYNMALISNAYGEIRLNGRIINGTIDGEKITNIKELINIYKKEKK